MLTVNDTSTSDDLSTVQLYLGGIPMSNELISALYPALTRVYTFNGCIRNVLSNGNYLNMSNSTSSINAYPGDCFPETNTIDTLVPWYTWLIMTLVLLFLITIIVIVLWTLQRINQELKVVTGFYMDGAVDNIIDYKFEIKN